MENIQIFNNPEFGDIRTVIINGEPWFVGRDLANALGYAKPEGAIRNNVDKDDTLTEGVTDSIGRAQKTLVVNESGLYSLIFNSKLKSAKKFKKWVTSEVLPSIRKTGTYGTPKTIPEQIQIIARGYTEIKEEVDTLKSDLKSLKMDLPLLPVEADKITTAARVKGVQVMGGKQSNAYKDRSIVNTVYRDIYKQLYRNFQITTYKALKRSQCDLALEIIGKYELPVVLADRIDMVNSQLSLSVVEK